MGIFKSKGVIGIEMDAYEIRAAEVGGTASKPYLLALKRVPLPEGIVKEGRVADPKALGNVLLQLWTDSKFRSRNILLGVSNQDVLLRFAMVPRGPEEKMDNIIRFHAQSFLPVQVSDVELDYVRLDSLQEKLGKAGGSSSQGGPASSIKILYVAGRRNMLNSFLQVFGEAGLKLVDIDVSLLALTRCIVGRAADKSVAIVHYTKDQVGLVILDHGIPALARILTINSSVYPNGVAYGEMDAEAIVAEIGSCIGYFLSQNPGASIDMCAMNTASGSGVDVRNSLSENLGMDVEIIDMTRVLDTRRFTQNNSLLGATDFSVSISLALRGLGE